MGPPIRKAEAMTEHSPLGFSGLHRYRNCSGSVAFTAALPDDETDPEWTAAGKAAHNAWAHCLKKGLDTWEVVGLEPEVCFDAPTYKLTAEDLAAGQVYLDVIRAKMAPAGELNIYIEELFDAPEIQPRTKSTLDCVLIFREKGRLVADITDYKHGEGQFVPVEWNDQLLGYAAQVAYRYPSVERFRLRIVQPRYAGEEPVREWEIHREPLMNWIETVLKPAMAAAHYPVNNPSAELNLKTGDWCRFCKARRALACPEHHKALAVVEQTAPLVALMSDDRLDELTPKVEALEMMISSFKAERLRRSLAGVKFKNSKIIAKKVFRKWKDGAENVLKAALGPCVMKNELKGPAEVEKLGKIAKQLTKEYAFSPDAGYTVAPIGDRRHSVVALPPTADIFDKYIDKDEDF